MQDQCGEIEIAGREYDCSYLPGRRACMVYRLALTLSSERYESLLARGWRRFGRTLFRPACRLCRECRSLRIDIGRFTPSKSQRRVQRRTADVHVSITRPKLTDEHLELYNAYHSDMHQRRGWPYSPVTADDYYESFVDGEFEFAREFQYRSDDRLVAIGLVDVTATAMSSIYFIHDPQIRSSSPGTMSVLRELEYGRRTQRQWLYMGYYIRDCISMNYKNRFHPHQLLADNVGDDQIPEWLAAPSE